MKSLEQIIQQAEKGDADAQFMLGSFFDEGFGLGQDHSESIRWFRKAAAQGHAAAQCSIGYKYAVGNGAPRDYAQARAWLRQAADENNAKAQLNLGLMCFRGQGAPRNCAEAAMWLRKAADQGDALAQVLLGSLFMNGMGVAKDYAEALRWLQQADDQGNADAETIIKHLYTNDADLLSLLKPTPVTSEVALAIYERFDDEVELLSDRDALTGILNRSAMLHALKANIDNVRAQRRMGTGGVSLIIIGLGNFAQSSGDSGPSFQDAVLFGLADRLADNLRQTDSLGRMASEEFAVCAPGATLRNATALAQRLRQAVAAEPFDTPLGRLPITVHVGVAALQADDSILSLLERAHAAMCSARKLVDFMAPTSRGLDVL